MVKFNSLFICMLFSFLGVSQTVIKATSQDWIGGPCCVSGTNYSVVIELPNSVKTIELDSVFLQHSGWLSSTLSPEYTENAVRKINITFNIVRGEMYDDLYMETDALKRIPGFEGAALIILKVNGIRFEKIISSFEQLQILAYP